MAAASASEIVRAAAWRGPWSWQQRAGTGGQAESRAGSEVDEMRSGIYIYKDGAVFPRPGLAGVSHVQHMGTMNVSWAFTSPPSGMAMVGQPGGGPIKHLSGLGA